MAVKVKCVHCGKKVFEMVTECPFCGKPVANKWAPTNVAASPRTWKETGSRKKNPVLFIVIGAILVAAAAVAIYFLK